MIVPFILPQLHIYTAGWKSNLKIFRIHSGVFCPGAGQAYLIVTHPVPTLQRSGHPSTGGELKHKRL
jgi:hypothetical protein